MSTIRRKQPVFHFCNSGFNREFKINFRIRSEICSAVLHLFFDRFLFLFLYVRSQYIVQKCRPTVDRLYLFMNHCYLFESQRQNLQLLANVAIKIYSYLSLPQNNCPEFCPPTHAEASAGRAAAACTEQRIGERSALRGQARVRQQSEARTGCQCCTAAQHTVSERRNVREGWSVGRARAVTRWGKQRGSGWYDG